MDARAACAYRGSTHSHTRLRVVLVDGVSFTCWRFVLVYGYGASSARLRFVLVLAYLMEQDSADELGTGGQADSGTRGSVRPFLHAANLGKGTIAKKQAKSSTRNIHAA